MLTRIRDRLSPPFGARAGPYRVALDAHRQPRAISNRGGTRRSANDAGLDPSPRERLVCR